MVLVWWEDWWKCFWLCCIMFSGLKRFKHRKFWCRNHVVKQGIIWAKKLGLKTQIFLWTATSVATLVPVSRHSSKKMRQRLFCAHGPWHVMQCRDTQGCFGHFLPVFMILMQFWVGFDSGWYLTSRELFKASRMCYFN